MNLNYFYLLKVENGHKFDLTKILLTRVSIYLMLIEVFWIHIYFILIYFDKQFFWDRRRIDRLRLFFFPPSDPDYVCHTCEQSAKRTRPGSDSKPEANERRHGKQNCLNNGETLVSLKRTPYDEKKFNNPNTGSLSGISRGERFSRVFLSSFSFIVFAADAAGSGEKEKGGSR